MKCNKILSLTLALAMMVSAAAGCSKENTDGSKPVENTQSTQSQTEESKVTGKITVLTNRTDIVDTVLADYAKKFAEKYPGAEVTFEAITDYEGDVKTRMSTTEYGDVLLMPDVAPSQYADYFEPLGTVDEMKTKYRYIESKGSYDGQVYALTTFGVASGMVYNKKVFEDAGVTELPNTPEKFLQALQKIKDSNPEVIPYYTNYAAGWPLDKWQDNSISTAGDANFNNSLAHTDEPFKKDGPLYTNYKLLYDIVNQKLCEVDPMTTDWEQSKQMMADGKIGAMMLGSWAISQVQALAANKDDISMMPSPMNVNGTVYVTSSPDYMICVNKNSQNKETALAYLDWFTNESGFAAYNESISPSLSEPMPDLLKPLDDLKVTYIEPAAAPKEEQGLTDKIAKEAEISLNTDTWKKVIVEKALASESFDDYMNELNGKWAAARADLNVQ